MPEKIKILVCYHKPFPLFSDEILTPVSVGHALTGDLFTQKTEKANRPQIFCDDDGENISAQNPVYNELTAVYWAWKNYALLGEPDYLGLMHYRRFLLFNEEREKQIYPMAKTDDFFERVGYSPSAVKDLLKRCDFLYCKGKVANVYEHFKDNHRVDDLDLAVKIALEKFPSYKKSAKKFLAGQEGCYCNMFVFPKEIFFRYCEFIFPVLEEYKRREPSGKRLFVSERLTGIFVQKLLDEGKKGIGLSYALLREKTTLSVFLPYESDEPFFTMATVTSLFERAEENSFYSIKLLVKNKKSDVDESVQAMRKRYPRHKITVLDVGEELNKRGLDEKWNERRFFPYLLGAISDEKGRCAYCVSKCVFLKDAANTLLEVNTDDFCFLYPKEEPPEKGFSFLYFDISKLRLPIFDFTKPKNGENVTNLLYYVQKNSFPLPRGAASCFAEDFVFSKEISRRGRRRQAEKTTVLILQSGAEKIGISGVLSSYFFEAYALVPSGVKLPQVSGEERVEVRFERRKKKSETLLSKAARYLRKNGVKKTLERIRSKLILGA